MHYSRTRTHERRRARRIRRIRMLVFFNAILLAALAGAGWTIYSALRDSPQAAPPATPAAPSHAAGTDAPASQAPPAASQEPAAAPPAEAPAGETDGPGSAERDGLVTLAFVGDILPAGSVARLMERYGYDFPFLEAMALLSAADIAAGNLESAITEQGTPAENKQYLFRGPAAALPAIRDAGFDVLNLANNHTLDYGWIGLKDTMDALDDHGIRHVGAGADDREAFAPVYVEAGGITVAFVGVSNVVPEVSWKAGPKNAGVAELYDPRRALEAVREADRNADVVVVLVHWGVERSETPEAYQKEKGRQLIDAGADLVIGSHPHVLQGIEAYNGKWIAYSLGNFVFNMTTSSRTAETGVLWAECVKGGQCGLTFYPMKAENTQPRPLEGEARKAILDRLAALSYGVEVLEDGRIRAAGQDGPPR